MIFFTMQVTLQHSPSHSPFLRLLWFYRDAVFRVLAVEQPESTVLNYAPGPLDTPMVEDLLADQRTDPGNAIANN